MLVMVYIFALRVAERMYTIYIEMTPIANTMVGCLLYMLNYILLILHYKLVSQ